MELTKPEICPKCGEKLIVLERMFYWRGTYFTGLVCESCNALWDNPEDSFLDHVKNTQNENV